MILLSSVFMPQPHCCHPAPAALVHAMRLAALNPSYAPPLEAEYATLSPSTHASSIPRKMEWVERSKTKNEGRRTARANGAMPPSDPMLGRYRVACPPPEYLAA